MTTDKQAAVALADFKDGDAVTVGYAEEGGKLVAKYVGVKGAGRVRTQSPARHCLQGHTACEQFAGAETNRSGYSCRQRKECFEQISDLAMNAMLELPVRAQGPADAAWRRAVETWLQQEGLISLPEPKTVTQFP